IVLLVLAFVCAFYAVLSARIFEQLRTPLSYPLIYLMGDVGSLRSSLLIFARPVLFSLLIATPILFVMLVMLSDSLVCPWRLRSEERVRICRRRDWRAGRGT